MSDGNSQISDWPQARWARILDRVELRQADIGLKFWGPPLWLEVTMTGPDSDRWPAIPERSESWNWQSIGICFEAETLFDQGANDDQLVVAVGRYTVENLILNAIHEIGEWLRFDGRRVFPAHPSAQNPPAIDDTQGNGSVQLAVTFTPSAPPTPPAVRAEQPVDEMSAQRQLRRLTELAGPPSRFTYLPATAIHYHAAGPTIRLHSEDGPATGWRSIWSSATIDAVHNDADEETLIAAVQRDVHGALVAWEADRICQAFYIDDRRPWRVSVAGMPFGNERTDGDGEVDEMVSFTVAYLDGKQKDAHPSSSGSREAPHDCLS